MHPNQENEEGQVDQKEEYTGFQKYFNRFDELIMKPLFILNYDKAKMKKLKAFHKTFADSGGEIASSFMSKKKIQGSAVFYENLLMENEV